jgi:hypothetical protein
LKALERFKNRTKPIDRIKQLRYFARKPFKTDVRQHFSGMSNNQNALDPRSIFSGHKTETVAFGSPGRRIAFITVKEIEEEGHRGVRAKSKQVNIE